MRQITQIVVADDEPEVATVLGRLIGRIYPNAQVVIVADGIAALEQITSAPVDLLIADYRMPGLDGLELARRLRMLQQRPLIVLVSGEQIDPEVAVEAGADALITKPVRMEELRRVIEVAYAQNFTS